MSLSVVDGKKQDTARCTINIDGTTEVFTDFVAVGYNGAEHTVKLLGNADIVTLSVALEVISKKFKERFKAMSPDDQAEFMNIMKQGVVK